MNYYFIAFWIIASVIISLVAILRLHKRFKVREIIGKEAVLTLNKQQTKQIISDWAKTQGLNVPPERIVFWRNRDETFGMKGFSEEQFRELMGLGAVCKPANPPAAHSGQLE